MTRLLCLDLFKKNTIIVEPDVFQLSFSQWGKQVEVGEGINELTKVDYFCLVAKFCLLVGLDYLFIFIFMKL